MFKQKKLSGLMAAALLAVSLAPAGGVFAAQPAQSGTVVASGLANPRGVTSDGSGNIYVAEAGSGGNTVVTIGEGDQKQEIHVGQTGQVTMISHDGAKKVVAGGFNSFASAEGEVVGPHGVAVGGGAIWLVTTAVPQGAPQGPTDGSLIRIDPQTGKSAVVTNLQAYEYSKNPDGFNPDSDPFGVAIGSDGMAYVTDAAGNDLLKVNTANGNIESTTVFAGIPLPKALQGVGPFAQGNPDRKGAQEVDSVPTGITISPDGEVYVGFLSGFPFLTGGTKVVRVSSTGAVSDAGTGLTQVLDVEYGPDGMLYASEFNEFSLQSTPPGYAPKTGKVVRIMPDGKNEIVADGLDYPNGIAFDANGSLYVAVDSLSPTDAKIIRIDNATTIVGMPRTGSGFPLDMALYLGLVALAAGCALRVTTPTSAIRNHITR